MVKEDLDRAADRLLEYASKTSRHVQRIEYDADGCAIPLCDLEGGDRCDIVAAYRNAAKIVLSDQGVSYELDS